jgi:transcriptional regulator with XRE-family HTH domain
MGNVRSSQPERLAEKLLQIRLALGLSQDGMLERLGLAEVYFRSRISAYELGNREPHLLVVLKYARCVGISTDVLIDDEMDLPERLLKDSKRGAIRSKSTSKSKRKR